MTRHWLPLFGLIAFIIALPLSGCVYRPDVQQGNVITDQDVSAIHNGMTQDQIRFKLGDPILTNIFADNRMVYVYTFQHSHHKMQTKRLIIFFKNNRIIDYWFDSQPPGAPILLPHPA